MEIPGRQNRREIFENWNDRGRK